MKDDGSSPRIYLHGKRSHICFTLYKSTVQEIREIYNNTKHKTAKLCTVDTFSRCHRLYREILGLAYSRKKVDFARIYRGVVTIRAYGIHVEVHAHSMRYIDLNDPTPLMAGFFIMGGAHKNAFPRNG